LTLFCALNTILVVLDLIERRRHTTPVRAPRPAGGA
jgi:hypothetical protein